MPNAFPQKKDSLPKLNQTFSRRYEGENDESYQVSDTGGIRFTVPKNRSVPQPPINPPSPLLNPAFQLLVLAFLGLAPAGLGAIVLAPLAALWALGVLIAHPLAPGDQIRVIVVWGIAILLLGLAIPMSVLSFARLSS